MDPQQRGLLENAYRALENGMLIIVTFSFLSVEGIVLTRLDSSGVSYGQGSRI